MVDIAEAQKKLLHLGVNTRAASHRAVHPVLEAYLNTLSGDWYRFGAQNYIVWTDKGPLEISREIIALPKFADFYIFATPFSFASCNGMMPKEFWEWITKLSR